MEDYYERHDPLRTVRASRRVHRRAGAAGRRVVGVTTAYVDPHPQPYSSEEQRICAEIHELKVKRSRAANAAERDEIQYAIYAASQQLAALGWQKRQRTQGAER